MERDFINEPNNFETSTLSDNNSSKVLKLYANYLYSTTHENAFYNEDSDDDSDTTSINVKVQSQEDLSSVGLLNLSFNNSKLLYNSSQTNFNTFNNYALSYNSPRSTVNNVNYHQSINFNYLFPGSQPISHYTNNEIANPFSSVNEFRQTCVCEMNFLPQKLALEASHAKKCDCGLQQDKKDRCGSRAEALRDVMLIGSGILEANKKEACVSNGYFALEAQANAHGITTNDKCVENVDGNQSFLAEEHLQQQTCEPSSSSLDFVGDVSWSKGFLTDEHFQQPCESFSFGNYSQIATRAKSNLIKNCFQQSYEPATVDSSNVNLASNERIDERYFQNTLNQNGSPTVVNEVVSDQEHALNSSVSEMGEKFLGRPRRKSNILEEDEELKYLYETKFKVGFIDTHCHIDFLFKKQNFAYSFEKYFELAETRDPFPKSFEGCVAIFCDPQTFYKLSWWEDILLNDMVWGAFGCHPHFSDNFGADEERVLRFALTHEKVKATGEIGLDYSGRNDKDHDLQKGVFEKQLTIALEIRKPIVIHCREAFGDAFEIMKRMLPKNYLIHLHCFTGTLYEASHWMEYFPNLYFGFTCIVTQTSKRALNVRRVVQSIPLNRILLETDAPYFRPPCLKDGYYSHPGMAIHVAAAISELHEVPLEKVLQATRVNTHNVYNI